jgi:hypothetical protein
MWLICVLLPDFGQPDAAKLDGIARRSRCEWQASEGIPV